MRRALQEHLGRMLSALEARVAMPDGAVVDGRRQEVAARVREGEAAAVREALRVLASL